MIRLTANPAYLAADYKARGIERQSSYSYFVIDRGLKPELDAKEFFVIFDRVTADLFPEELKKQPEGKKMRIKYRWYCRDVIVVEEGPSLAGGYIKWVSLDGNHRGTDHKDFIVEIIKG